MNPATLILCQRQADPMRSFSNATQMSRCALRGNCRPQLAAYVSGLCSLSIFLFLSSIPAYAEWEAVEKDYLLPGLQTVYVDPESMTHTLCLNRKPVVLIDVSVTRHASSHTPRELREGKQPNTLSHTVELLVSLRGQKSMRPLGFPSLKMLSG